jgi:hypothetical protein
MLGAACIAGWSPQTGDLSLQVVIQLGGLNPRLRVMTNELLLHPAS